MRVGTSNPPLIESENDQGVYGMKHSIKNLLSDIRASLRTMLFCGCLFMALTGHQSLTDYRLTAIVL
jgi:hypothetical protein